MNSQTDINARMRGILFDWLVEVALDYTLSPETLHLSFNYIDRYLSRVAVNRTRLQLVGITCMFLASYVPLSHFPPRNCVCISSSTKGTRKGARRDVPPHPSSHVPFLPPSCCHSKYEEISPPSVESFVYMTENTYDREDVSTPCGFL